MFILSLALFLSQRVPGFTDAAADLDNGAANVRCYCNTWTTSHGQLWITATEAMWTGPGSKDAGKERWREAETEKAHR